MNVLLLARILCTGYEEPATQQSAKLVATAIISGSEGEPAVSTANAIANVAAIALDLIEGTKDISSLHAIDLQAQENPGDKK